jgi:hypothetical protein
MVVFRVFSSEKGRFSGKELNGWSDTHSQQQVIHNEIEEANRRT